jgi:hypothetical protein
MTLTFLGTVLSKATLGARLTTHCALHSKKFGKLDWPPATKGLKEGEEQIGKRMGKRDNETGLQEN